MFIKTQVKGSTFTATPLNHQKELKEVPGSLEDLLITVPTDIKVQYPPNTLFFAQNAQFPFPDQLVIHSNGLTPLLHFPTENIKDATVYSAPHNPLSLLNDEGRETIFTAYLDYVILSDGGMDKAKLIAEKFTTAFPSFVVDWEARTPKFDEDNLPQGVELRQTIQATFPVPSVAECGFHVDPETWFLLVRNVLKGKSILLSGPTGSGKTELVALLAQAMKRELSTVDMGTIQDPQSALLGVHRLNSDGQSEFDYAPFVGHIQKPNSIILLDEINRSSLASQNVLFSCLDKRRYLAVDIAHGEGERKIYVNPKAVFIATANLGGEYTGTNAIDRALMDRFFIMELDYPSVEDEQRIIMKKTNVSATQARKIVEFAFSIRNLYNKQDLSSSVSVRHTLEIGEMVNDGFDLQTSITTVVMPLYENSIGGGNSERSKVSAAIAAY